MADGFGDDWKFLYDTSDHESSLRSYWSGDSVLDSSGYLYSIITNKSGIEGRGDLILLKSSASGKSIWSKLIQENTSESAISIATDGNGNLYVTANSDDTTGVARASLKKISPEGELIWSKTVTAEERYQSYLGRGIGIGSDGSIYVAGRGVSNTIGGNWGTFISKVSPQGETEWIRYILNETEAINYGVVHMSIFVDKSDSIYLADKASNTFDGRSNPFWKYIPGPYPVATNPYVGKFRSTGETEWISFFDKRDQRRPSADADTLSLTANPTALYKDSEGDVYLTGDYANDLFAAKISESGDVQWFNVIGSEYYQNSFTLPDRRDSARDIVTGKDSSLYITGFTEGALGQFPYNKNYYPQRRPFILSLDKNGEKLWSRTVEPTSISERMLGSPQAIALSIIQDLDSDLYLSGGVYARGGHQDQDYFFVSKHRLLDAPSGIEVSNLEVSEDYTGIHDFLLGDGGRGIPFAVLSTVDSDERDVWTYSLVSGEGDEDNHRFTIINDEIIKRGLFDYEEKSSYSFRLRTEDSGGLSFQKSFVLRVNDVTETPANRTPTDLKISSSSFNENIASGSTVATLSTVDPDSGDSFSYDLVAGNGSTDNSYFSIFRTGLIIKASPDFETKSSYNVRIRTQDSGGLSLEKAFTLSVNDINETPIPTPSPQEPVANPGITVRSTSGNNTTSETGTTASYSFVLKTAPTDRVTITFTLSDGSEGSLSSNTLIFTPGNWDIAQTLTVTGLDDYENDGDIPYVISAVVSSDDPNYGRRRDGTGGVSISNIELVNEDDGLEKDLTIYGDSNAPNYNDLLSGKNGSDRLYGDRGRDRLYGGRGGDRLYGGVDDDTLWGEDGDDDLYGNEDDDTLYGGNGNDRLTGGEGYDLLTGGIGNDTYVIDDEFDVIDDQGLESDQDKVIIRGNITAYTLPQGIEGATLDGTVAKNLIGNAGNNELIGNANNNLLDGGEGSDYLYSASGDDSVFGGGGDDQIVGGDGKGDDAYDGGEGEDTVIYKSSERNPIEVNLRSGFGKGAEIGSDTLKDIEHIVAGQQDDLITGDARDNKIDGLAGRDTAVFQGLRSEYLVSRNSAGKLVVQDKLGGRDGSDTLVNVELFKFADNTYNADEVLKGSKDLLLGEGEHRGQGKGTRITTQVNQADRITLAPVSFKSTSPDIITGFLPAEDKIVLPKAVFAKLKNTNMTTISSKKQLKKSKSGLNSTQLVYNKMTGEVIYDENGKKKGLGAGGVFARFEDATLPNLTATNFELG